MTLLNVGSIKSLKLLASVWLEISDLYLFHLIVLLNPNFSCFKSLLSSFDDNVTTVTYSIKSFILIVAFVGAFIAGKLLFASAVLVAFLVIAQFSNQVKVKDTLQLINVISSVLQKLLTCFNIFFCSI